MNIKALLKQIEGGDRSAFTRVVEHFRRPLFGYLGRMGLHQGPAEEIAQETFLRAWSRLGDYNPARSEFSTWLFTIGRNLALHELARAAAKHEVATSEALPDVACERVQPTEASIDMQRRHRVHAALRALPLMDRSALALAYFQELDLASSTHRRLHYWSDQGPPAPGQAATAPIVGGPRWIRIWTPCWNPACCRYRTTSPTA